MSVQRPTKADEITQAIQHGRPFWGPKLNGETIAVMTGALKLTGPLAAEVEHTALDYQEQYLTGGGRSRADWHVVYYVTIADPDAKGARYVVAYVTAGGSTQIRAHRALSKPLTAAVSLGVGYLRSTAQNLATERGDYPLQPEGHRDGEGETFTLWGRDAHVDVRETPALRHYTDRHEAYEAFRQFEREGEPFVSPSGYRGTHNHAWITRGATPLGETWGAQK